MKIRDIVIRIGIALLFIWAGLEKFIEGFLGGVGLENMAAFLKDSGLAFLGDTGTYALAAILAALELITGILVLLNKQLLFAYTFLAFIILMALFLVHLPSNNWMNIMIHIMLLTTLTGLAVNEKQAV